MALTYAEMVGELGAWFDLDVTPNSEGETTVKRALNWGARRVWNARFWHERRGVTQVYTALPYSTGTVTLTNLSTTVTGSGTTWTSAMTGRKIARSLQDPPYRFTYVGATSGTIAPSTGYAEATASGAGYVIYQDEYDIATDVQDIYECQLFRQEMGGKMDKVSESALDGGRFIHGVSGYPVAFSQTGEQTVGTKRLRVYPIPDAVYRIQVKYWKRYSNMTAPGSTCGLHEDKEFLVLKTAALYLQGLSDVRPLTSESEVSQLIEQASRELQDNVPIAYVKNGFDAGAGNGGLYLNSDNMGIS